MKNTLGVLAHVDAGKTTLAECILFHSNTIRTFGRVDNGDTHMSGNEELRQIAEASNGRIKACYILHPRLDGVQMPKAPDLLEWLRRDRPAAVTIRPADHGYPMTDLYCGELLEVLQELRMPLLLSNSAKVFPEFDTRIPALAAEFTELPIVVSVNTYTTCMFNYICMKNTENILLGVGGMEAFSELDHLVNTYGSHRFVLSSTAGCLAAGALGLVYMGRFSQTDKEAILGGNWQRIQEGIQWES